MEGRTSKGFTLIELLIVVAIIAILAAIAVPNFLEAQTRSKVARVHNDLRTINNAVTAYYLDHDTYPPFVSWVPLADRLITYRPGPMWIALSTPVCYLSSALRDAFTVLGAHTRAGGQLVDPFYPCAPGFLGAAGGGWDARTEWFGMSFGPDMSSDTGLKSAYPYTRTASPYDPTNGTVSWGDIFRHAGRIPVNFIVGTSGHGSNVNDTQGFGDPYAWAY